MLTGQVAAGAGVPRTYVYRHFDGKRALELAVARHVAAQIGHRIRTGLATQGSVQDVIRAAISQHLGWVEDNPNLYRFLARHAYAVNATGSPAVDDAKAAFAKELTAVLAGYLELFGVDTTPAERVIIGVVGMVDATAAWRLEHRELARDELAAALTAQLCLVLDHTGRDLGLVLDRNAQLPGS